MAPLCFRKLQVNKPHYGKASSFRFRVSDLLFAVSLTKSPQKLTNLKTSTLLSGNHDVYFPTRYLRDEKSFN